MSAETPVEDCIKELGTNFKLSSRDILAKYAMRTEASFKEFRDNIEHRMREKDQMAR